MAEQREAPPPGRAFYVATYLEATIGNADPRIRASLDHDSIREAARRQWKWLIPGYRERLALCERVFQEELAR